MTHAEITHDPSALVPPQSPVPFTLADTPAWLLTPLPALRLAPQDALDDLRAARCASRNRVGSACGGRGRTCWPCGGTSMPLGGSRRRASRTGACA